MTAIYRDDDADLSVLDGRRLAVIGYGNQGRAQALNLRDSGIRNVTVGTSKPPSEHPARADGFEVLSIAEAVRQADIVFLLVPDEVMPAVYREQIEPQLEPGMTLDFASGYNLTFKRIVPSPSLDVVMLAPRMIGDGVRELFRRETGYPAFVAVHQDATGRARSTVLALAKAIGATRQGAIEVTFKDETMLDLLAEQAIWPLILAVITEAFRLQTEKGHPVEASLTELYLSKEPAYMLGKMAEVGLFGQMPFHSHTSQYGQLSRHETLDKTFIRRTLEQAYAYIESGDFAEEWTREQAAGMPEYQRLIRQALNSEISRLEEPLLAGKAGTMAETDADTITLNDAVVSEQRVRAAIRQQVKTIRLAAGALLTPSAQDAAREHRVTIVRSEAS
jgi:ketol-acid reductoisomerase